MSSVLKNVEYRVPSDHNVFHPKGLNATEISKELDSVYKYDASSYRTVAKWVAEFKNPERTFEDSLRTGRPSTITINENIEAVERIVMRNRQISVRRVAYELRIPTTTVYEIMSNHLGMKKVSTRWVPKLLTSIQRAKHVDCCQEHIPIPSVNKKSRSGRRQVKKHQLDFVEQGQLKRS